MKMTAQLWVELIPTVGLRQVLRCNCVSNIRPIPIQGGYGFTFISIQKYILTSELTVWSRSCPSVHKGPNQSLNKRLSPWGPHLVHGNSTDVDMKATFRACLCNDTEVETRGNKFRRRRWDYFCFKNENIPKFRDFRVSTDCTDDQTG